jgi:hypothetical protein
MRLNADLERRAKRRVCSAPASKASAARDLCRRRRPAAGGRREGLPGLDLPESSWSSCVIANFGPRASRPVGPGGRRATQAARQATRRSGDEGHLREPARVGDPPTLGSQLAAEAARHQGFGPVSAPQTLEGPLASPLSVVESGLLDRAGRSPPLRRHKKPRLTRTLDRRYASPSLSGRGHRIRLGARRNT